MTDVPRPTVLPLQFVRADDVLLDAATAAEDARLALTQWIQAGNGAWWADVALDADSVLAGTVRFPAGHQLRALEMLAECCADFGLTFRPPH